MFTAMDNSEHVTSIQISGPTSGAVLDVGEHVVTYMAFDAINNTAICQFPVVLKRKLS